MKSESVLGVLLWRESNINFSGMISYLNTFSNFKCIRDNTKPDLHKKNLIPLITPAFGQNNHNNPDNAKTEYGLHDFRRNQFHESSIFTYFEVKFLLQPKYYTIKTHLELIHGTLWARESQTWAQVLNSRKHFALKQKPPQ